MRVGIIGASGYTGGELLRLLAGHPEVEVACVTSRTFKGAEVGSVHPNLRGILDMRFEDLLPEAVASRSDFVFLATPHTISMQMVPKVLERGVKVVDLSGDFRFRDVATYERYYKVKHQCPELKGVYGLPELHRREIKGARLVANPGCYPTSAILGLAPLVKEGLIDLGKIVVDAKSGISGAGAEPTQKTHFAMADGSVLAYSVTSHRHLPEIEQELGILRRGVKISFVPHLVPVVRGLSSTIHAFLSEVTRGEEIQKLYRQFYQEEPFIRVLGAGEVPRMSAVRGSNFVDIGCFGVDSERGRLVVVSTLDNLVKGAAGQAIQNMNIMQGYQETLGLRGLGIHP
ncbi:MAG: N-acetyl-gamma-glutamyl-phosphate reductase [Candidatus Hydrothermarchaeota archaeon]